MNRQEVQIEPTQITQVKNVTSFTVIVANLQLFKSVTILVRLFDENNKFVDSKSLTLDGTDYTNWNNDDNYIINYVASHYGFTKK
jgi:hypothetical protein